MPSARSPLPAGAPAPPEPGPSAGVDASRRRGSGAGSGPVERLGSWWPWVAGAVGAVVVLGPALGPGSLLNLDLVLTPRWPVPPGLFGLGPALPQRVPAGLPQVALGPLLGGPAAGKLVLAVAIAAAFAGAVRLSRGAGTAARVGAGVLYALGPFAVTRAADGHLNVLVVLAVLPFALPTLVHPGERLDRTFLWALALSLAGSPGGATAATVVVVGLVADRGRRALPVLGALLLSCLVWLAPSASVLAAGAGVSGAGRFATVVRGPVGFARLLLGGGFWRGDDLGARGWWVVPVAGAVVALAVLGHARLPARLRSRLLAVGLAGLALALASSVPGVRDVYRWFTDLPIGAPFRESQRSVCLWLAWLAPAAALGATEVGRVLHRRGERVDRPALLGAAVAVPVAFTVAAASVGGPAWWGAGGRMDPVDFPAGWSAVHRAVEAHPGTVLALPWKEYLDLSFAGGRRVLNPLPDYLGGDVLSSYDPEFDLAHPAQEQVDRRAHEVDRLLPSLLTGAPPSNRLRELGVRWVVLLHESTPLPAGSPPLAVERATWERYRPALVDDHGMRLAHDGASVELWEVRGWRGPVRPGSGGRAPIDGPLPILRSTPAGAGIWNRAGAPGWLRGLTPVPTTDDGLLELPAGHGIIWFWPGFLVLAADGIVVIAALLAWRGSPPSPDQLRGLTAPGAAKASPDG